jgi:hypothetical protein
MAVEELFQAMSGLALLTPLTGRLWFVHSRDPPVCRKSFWRNSARR